MYIINCDGAKRFEYALGSYKLLFTCCYKPAFTYKCLTSQTTAIMYDHLSHGGESYADRGLRQWVFVIVIWYVQYKRKARKSSCEKHECIPLLTQLV